MKNLFMIHTWRVRSNWFSVVILCFLIPFLGGCGNNKSSTSDASGESDQVQINFELTAQVLGAGGGGVNDEPVLLEAEKYVWNSEEERYDLHDHVAKNDTTKTVWSYLVAYPGYTDPFSFGYKIGKVGSSHPSYVLTRVSLVNFPAVSKTATFWHADALSIGDGSTLRQTIPVNHPNL